MKADHVTYCVFLPVHTTSNEWGHTQFVRCLIGSEACRVAHGKLSLRREFSPAFLEVPALPGSSPQRKDSTLRLSSSEEVEVEDVDD